MSSVYRQEPQRPSKALEDMVGAAPLSRGGALCGSALASCFGGEALDATTLAVLVSAGCGSDLGRLVPAALAAGFGAEAADFVFGAALSELFDWVP